MRTSSSIFLFSSCCQLPAYSSWPRTETHSRHITESCLEHLLKAVPNSLVLKGSSSETTTEAEAVFMMGSCPAPRHLCSSSQVKCWRLWAGVSKPPLGTSGREKFQEATASTSKVKRNSVRVGVRQHLRTSDGGQILLPFRYETFLPHRRTKACRSNETPRRGEVCPGTPQNQTISQSQRRLQGMAMACIRHSVRNGDRKRFLKTWKQIPICTRSTKDKDKVTPRSQGTKLCVTRVLPDF